MMIEIINKSEPLKMTVYAQKLSFFLIGDRWNAKKQHWPYMTTSCSPFSLPLCLFFFPTLICTASSELGTFHILFFLTCWGDWLILHSLRPCVAYGLVYWTCLGKKHRKVSFTAKDPNGELWRFEECPDLKHTCTEEEKIVSSVISIMIQRLFKL